MKTIDYAQHPIVSQEEWQQARRAFLEKEKAYLREGDELARQRRELPWTRVDANYMFDGPRGKESLSDLFDGRSQLIIYHFMLGPDAKEGCPGCSFVSDHIDGAIPHLNERDVTLLAVSRAPLPQIEAFKKRMGWCFKWVSSQASNFNFDYHVSFTKSDLERGTVFYNYEDREVEGPEKPGASVFFKDHDGAIYHTYSTYERGLDPLVGTYRYLDIAPKGRDEDNLPGHPMSWVRHHDRYENRPAPTQAAKSCCCSEEGAP
jgi:predicted dithiol-disulfide oxidoreductase (DUF899 family)